MKNIIIVSFLFIFFISCGDSDHSDSQDLLTDFEFADSLTSQVIISEKIIDDMIHSIPSPIEMTSLILESGAEFDDKILIDPDRVDNYATAHSKAIALGMFGTELGYLNIYGKTMISVEYLTAVRSLARDLRVEQFFDFHTLKRLADESDNMDSLINVTTQGFSRMDAYLREQKRTKASVMIVAGTFIEGLFIATQIRAKTVNDQLTERIGEQKMSLNNMIVMFEVYKSDPEVEKLVVDFNELKTLYDQVQIITTYGEPITKEVDGMLVIEDQSTSEVKMAEELLTQIIVKTKELRTKII